ncbi:MAG TPA: DinB family protein [Puia sp.]|nr:DinB family protein [Puia sp.]
MQATIELLQKIAANYSSRMKGLSEDELSWKPSPEKWSKKEILGHLVDSAQNNIRRFVVAQYEEVPDIVYDQDKWVNIAGYQHYPGRDLLQLWELLNRHIGQVLENTSPEAAQRKCKGGGADAHTIEWLAADYCNHLLHHLHQILELEPIAYP